MATTIIEENSKKFTISYEILNHSGTKDIIFLHGWGSNKEVMKSAFGKLFPQFRHVYVDLPGFGKSSNEYVLSTKDYANVLDLFLKEKGFEKDVIVGHSFGGKVATLLSPQLLVLLSSAGIVWPKPLKVRVKIALFKMLKPFGKNLRRFFVAQDAKGMSENMYETFKNVVDEDFSSVFANFRGEALLFWGKDDRATPLKSAYRIKELIPKSELFVYDGDHYFFLQYAEQIAKEIECKAADVL